MVPLYRLTDRARDDIVAILSWSDEQFGEEARRRYEGLIVTAIRDASAGHATSSRRLRPDLGEHVFTWHLVQSRDTSTRGLIRRPRHFLVCREDGGVLVIGRILHEAMDITQHVHPEEPWT